LVDYQYPSFFCAILQLQTIDPDQTLVAHFRC